MKSLPVIPHVGIGPLRLGMSPTQILAAIHQLRSEWSLPENQDIQISKDIEDEGFTLRYQDNCFFFMVQYQNNKAVEVAVNHDLREHGTILLYDIDVFKTLAENLVATLKQYSSCSYDLQDEQLSTNYEFNKIGVRLWREDAFHKTLLADESYMKEMALVIDDMYRYLYFEIVAVK